MGRKTKEGTVPLFIGNADLSQHQKGNDHCGTQAVMGKTGNGRQVKNGRSLPHECSINNRGYTAKKAQ